MTHSARTTTETIFVFCYFYIYCCYPTKWNVDVGKLGMCEINRHSIIERGVRTKRCCRNHRAEILTNHHTENSHELDMSVARFSNIFFCCCCLVFLGRFSRSFSPLIQSFSQSQFMICMSFTFQHISAIFSFSLNLLSCFLVCDLILVFMPFHSITCSSSFASFCEWRISNV